VLGKVTSVNRLSSSQLYVVVLVPSDRLVILPESSYENDQLVVPPPVTTTEFAVIWFNAFTVRVSVTVLDPATSATRPTMFPTLSWGTWRFMRPPWAGS
jgi:hypothetical protein